MWQSFTRATIKRTLYSGGKIIAQNREMLAASGKFFPAKMSIKLEI
jgi:hypothetical protein